MTTATATAKARAGRHRGDPAHWFHDLLTSDQERALVARARAGDRAARDELILKNQRLVIHVARQSLGGFHDMDDLVSAGNRGLIRAVERFDPARGVRFATYAVRWIRYTIQCEVRDTGFPIRVSGWVLALAAGYRKAEARLRAREGTPPGFARVCEAMRLSEGQRRCLADALAVAALEFLSCEAEPLPPGRDPSPDQPLDDREVRARVEALVGRLTPRQARVIRLHYGLGPGAEPGLSLVEIARREGRKWQAVQGARNKALDRLRSMAGAGRLAGP